MRELAQDFHDFARTLSACRDHHNIDFGIPADRVLENCFPRAEGSRCAEGSAFCDREKGVDGPHLGDHRFDRHKFFLVAGDRDLDRPFLDHGHDPLFAFRIPDFRHGIGKLVASRRCDFRHFPRSGKCERKHDVMFENSFRDISETIRCDDFIAHFRHRSEFPDRIVIQRIHVETSLEEESGFFRKFRQRILKSVINLGQQTGSEFDAEKRIGEFHRIADFQSVGTFEDLQVRPGSANTDDLAFQFDIAQDGECNFILRHAGLELHGQQIAVDSDDPSHFLVFKHIL